jgi:hypothetical protein
MFTEAEPLTFVICVVIVISVPGVTSVAVADCVTVISLLGVGVGVEVGVDVNTGVGVGVGVGVDVNVGAGAGVGVIITDETDPTAVTAFTTPDPEMVSSPGTRISLLADRSVVASVAGDGLSSSACSTRAATPPTYDADAEVQLNLNGVTP